MARKLENEEEMMRKLEEEIEKIGQTIRKLEEEIERERDRVRKLEEEIELEREIEDREREREEEEERKREREKDRLVMNSRGGGGEGFEKRSSKGEEEKKEREGERNARDARLRAERTAVEWATSEAREQSERDRIAENLDAEVKRWSSGKEGNLRTLLSTLQYIFGQNSGWQSIHLTEVITAADVKKAYRKALLYVHTDKLQQRGASIHEKYICEKVFHLLQEAWNKFNSEESPEHHLLRAKGRLTLGSDCGVATPRSNGSNGPVKPSVRRIRRRSISITPEIGDDIVR